MGNSGPPDENGISGTNGNVPDAVAAKDGNKRKFLDWASVTNEKGLFYRKIGLFEESISVMESLRKALLKEQGRHSPEYASLLNNLGGTYRKMGDKDTAIALLKKVLPSIRPKHG
ncbi:tetratricopeptide repeat protein [Acidaminococcus intestini]|nr:tetratricopeptide repeat protein [Acidaminococcus intestini]